MSTARSNLDIPPSNTGSAWRFGPHLQTKPSSQNRLNRPHCSISHRLCTVSSLVSMQGSVRGLSSMPNGQVRPAGRPTRCERAFRGVGTWRYACRGVETHPGLGGTHGPDSGRLTESITSGSRSLLQTRPQPMAAASDLVAGARFAPDSDSVPVVAARWLYAGVKQGTREMVRVGPVA